MYVVVPIQICLGNGAREIPVFTNSKNKNRIFTVIFTVIFTEKIITRHIRKLMF